MDLLPPDARLSLSRLCEEAGRLLSLCGVAPEDGRVSPSPDERTVRYYQSTGLVDRPLSYEGRQALYGRRHLLQLVAIKLLQQQGLSLAQVQQALSGQPDARLEAALAQSLGRPVPPPPLAPLYAAGVGPGLTLVVDPSVHADPAALAARVAAFLRSPVR